MLAVRGARSYIGNKLGTRFDNKVAWALSGATVVVAVRGHVCELCVNLLTVELCLLLALLEALQPRLHAHLNVWHPYNVAAVVDLFFSTTLYLAVNLLLDLFHEAVDLVVHAIPVFGGMLHVLLNQLDFLIHCYVLNIAYLLLKHMLSVDFLGLYF